MNIFAIDFFILDNVVNWNDLYFLWNGWDLGDTAIWW